MEKDPLLDELADAIAQGPVIFTPDDSWEEKLEEAKDETCLLYTSPSPRDRQKSRMPSSA